MVEIEQCKFLPPSIAWHLPMLGGGVLKILHFSTGLALTIAVVTQHQHLKVVEELMHELLMAITNETDIKFASNTVDRWALRDIYPRT